jgi:hypothetical protein
MLLALEVLGTLRNPALNSLMPLMHGNLAQITRVWVAHVLHSQDATMPIWEEPSIEVPGPNTSTAISYPSGIINWDSLHQAWPPPPSATSKPTIQHQINGPKRHLTEGKRTNVDVKTKSPTSGPIRNKGKTNTDAVVPPKQYQINGPKGQITEDKSTNVAVDTKSPTSDPIRNKGKTNTASVPPNTGNNHCKQLKKHSRWRYPLKRRTQQHHTTTIWKVLQIQPML